MEGVIRISRFFQMQKQFCWGSSVFQIAETTDNLKIVCLYFSDTSVCKPVTWLLSVICSAPLSSVSMKRKIHEKRQTDTHTCWWCNFAHGQSRNENVTKRKDGLLLTCLCSPPRAQNPSGSLGLRISPCSASYFPRCIFRAEASRSLQVVVDWGGKFKKATSEGRLAVPWSKAGRGGRVPWAKLWSSIACSMLAKVRATHLDFGFHPPVKLQNSHPSIGLRPDDGPGPGRLPRPALRAARTPRAPWRHLAVDHWGEQAIEQGFCINQLVWCFHEPIYVWGIMRTKYGSPPPWGDSSKD